MSDQEPTLTNRQGHPVRDNQHTITVGPKGLATLDNYNAIEKLAQLYFGATSFAARSHLSSPTPVGFVHQPGGRGAAGDRRS